MASEFEKLAQEAREKAERLLTTAEEMHRAGWDRVLGLAHGGSYPWYGIYGSRILAVPHPEVYLRADALFWQIASTVRGFREGYGITHAADMYNMQWSRALAEGQPLSEPLTWSDVPADAYSVVRARSHYPEGYPFYPFLDRRLAPLAVTLKVWGRRLSAVELAEHEYFRARAEGEPVDGLFVIACDDESAYLARRDRLLSVATRSPVEAPGANPVLIFNEDSVWYPLMGRDDTARSPGLARVVGRLRTATDRPALLPEERAYVEQLRRLGQLRERRQFDMAMLAALRANGIEGDPYRQVWERSVVPYETEHPWLCDRKLGIIRECNRFANYLSPAVAYLAALLATAPTQEIGIHVLCGEYLKHAGVVRDDERKWKKPGRLEAWGHLWYCPLMEYTIDDSYRSGGGHCVSQSINLSVVLDLAGVDHYVTHFNRGGILTTSHHFVSSCDGRFVIDDAMVNYFATGVPKTDDWGCLLSFSKDGLWASLVIGQCFGNVSPRDVVAHVDRIEEIIGGRFALSFLSLAGGDEIQPKERFLDHIASINDWEPVRLP